MTKNGTAHQPLTCSCLHTDEKRKKKRQLSGFSLETGLRGSIEKWSIAQVACCSVKTLPTSAGDSRDESLFPGSGRVPGGGTRQPTPVFLPGESHGQRSLVGYNPWDRRVGYDWACTHTEKWLGTCMACCCVCEGLTHREKTGGLPLWLPTPTVTVSLLSPAKQHCTQIPNSAHVWSSSSSFCSPGICWVGSPHRLTMTRRTQTNSIARHHCSNGNEVPPPCSSPHTHSPGNGGCWTSFTSHRPLPDSCEKCLLICDLLLKTDIWLLGQ